MPFEIPVDPGSRTELVIRGRELGHFQGGVPMFLAFMIATFSGFIPDYKNRWVEYAVFLAVFTALYAGYVLVTSILSDEWWARWILERVETPSPSQALSG
jgi:hypothetical protein